MHTVYNVDFEMAAAILSIFIFTFHCLRYSTESQINREFRRLIFSVFFANFMDVVTGITITHTDVIPGWVNLILNTIYFTSQMALTYIMLRYVVAYVHDKLWKSKTILVGSAIVILDVLAIIINLFTQWLFYFDENGYYQHGPGYLLCYIVPFIMLAFNGGYLLSRHRYYSKGQFWAILCFSIGGIIAAIMQSILYPEVLTMNFVAAVFMLNIFFFLETPDYQKMVKTMADLEYLQANLKEEVKRQTAVATEKKEAVEQMSLQMVQTLATTIDAKDRYTNGHSSRVAYYSVLLARELGWNEEAVTALRYKGLLHDIGKIGVADVILNKPSRLKKVEYEVIQSHTVVGYEILRDSSFLPGSEDVARYHHERYDGLGYPDGLKGREIPADARIVAIADAYDAMNSDRVYRKALPKEIIRKELYEGRGKQFDPEYLDAFLRLFDMGRLDLDGDEHQLTETPHASSGRLMRKVMESIQAQSKNENVDFLSGVMRREDGEDRIIEEMRKNPGCLVLIDVHNLRIVNENAGRIVGDKVIAEIGGLLNDRRDEMIASRNGGSQFLCFITDVDDVGVYDVMDRIFAGFEQLKENDTRFASAQLYAGMCLTTTEDDYFECYAKADKALYHVVQTQKPGYFFYRHLEDGYAKTGADLGMLVEGLKKNRSEGAVDVQYEDFTKFYEYIMNLWRRYHHSFVLAMITIDDVSGGDSAFENREKAVACMELAIRRTIRTVDVCTRYSSSQLLIILLEVGEDNVTQVIKRIFQDYYKMYNGKEMDINYEVANLDLENELED